ncbi:MAG: formate dehydrogenase accessory sulfurtransferase FdhD [Desulfobulbaceae bacterium]|nr:formate dehydrogenase accessory sulfurtransferase FdhD [Desulfobulbaceae bacterium]
MKPATEILLIRVNGDQSEDMVDLVATEIAFTLIVNDEILVSLLCSPIELDAMAIGFLCSEGLLRDRDSLLGVEVDEPSNTVRVQIKDLPQNWQQSFNKKTITSGCGKGITFTDPATLQHLAANRRPIHISTAMIKELFSSFRNRSELYIQTGGVHSAALADSSGIILFAEDIGRHNAVDKLIGKAFLESIDLTDKILLSSGRISGEIMTKIVRGKIPVLITRTAPTCMSLTYAEDHGVTLIGFARGNRMNIYTHPHGVILDNIIEL